jgi:hypothetical protein
MALPQRLDRVFIRVEAEIAVAQHEARAIGAG